MITRIAPIENSDLCRWKTLRGDGYSLVSLCRCSSLCYSGCWGKQCLRQMQTHRSSYFYIRLPIHLRRQLWAAGEIDDLDKVLEQAKVFHNIEEQSKTTAAVETQKTAEVGALKEQISVLTEQVAALVTRRTAT